MMQRMKYVIVFLSILAFGFASYTGCGSPNTSGENAAEGNTNNTDGGTTTDTAGTDSDNTNNNNNNTNNNNNNTTNDGGTQETPPEGPVEAGPPITVEFTPADGSEIGISDCIKVKFSREPSQSKANRSAEFLQDGSSSPLAVSFNVTGVEGEICPFSLLFYDTSYKLTLKIKDPDDKTKEYTATASYKTKKAPTSAKPLDVGSGINLKLKGVKSPVALQSLLGSVSPDQIPPILLTLHSREQGASGKLLYVGGLGKAPAGGKPHEGKDVIDTKTPVSLALDGTFNGDAFYVGPTNFILSIAGFNLQLEDLRITGTFTDDGKNIKEATLEGVIDPELIKQQFGLDACATLLRDDCFKNADGKDRVRIVGSMEGIANPLEFSVFITSPLYLQQGVVGAAGKLEIYFSEEVKDTDVTLTFSTCSGSSSPDDKPCDAGKGATITPATVDGEFKLDSTSKFGTFTPKTGFQAATWYKVDITAKNSGGKEFKTFVMFKTQ